MIEFRPASGEGTMTKLNEIGTKWMAIGASIGLVLMVVWLLVCNYFNLKDWYSGSHGAWVVGMSYAIRGTVREAYAAGQAEPKLNV